MHISRVAGWLLIGVLGWVLPAEVAAEEAETDPRIDLLVREIEAGIERRGLEPAFERYLAWTANRLDASAGDRTWADKTGNCRLSWVDRMLREPLWALGEAERFTRHLHEAAQRPEDGLRTILATAAQRLDLPAREVGAASAWAEEPASAEAAIDLVAEALEASATAMEAALAPLSEAERAELERLIYPMSTGEGARGHRFADQAKGRRVCDLMEAMDRAALHRAGEAVAVLTAPGVLDALASYEPGEAAAGGVAVEGVTGEVHERITTEAGDIVIGGRGDNVYELERMTEVAAVIDLGGDDTYVEGTVGSHRPVLVLLDLGGDDVYRGTEPGIQAGAILGVSLLVNRAGENTYEAHDVAQGACLAGMGMLVDRGEATRYVGRRRVQGAAVGGVGLLVDEGGDDAYRAALLSQGTGGPLGFGMLVDLAGDDHFYAGGLMPNSYGDTPGYDAFSQGVGVGPRGVANGGIGVLLAGGGDNVYECDYFSHGGGYWFAAGFARDFSGNDQRVGATRTAFDGGEREERRFLRWGIGWQAHYGLGFVIDDEGDDFYAADHAGPAFSWDIGLAALMDFDGDDHYKGLRAAGVEAGLGIAYDYAGDDVYEGGSLARTREEVTYHPMPEAGGNFSFLIDYGGEDLFGDGIDNNSYERRGAAGGFLISRPAPPSPEQIGTDPDVSADGDAR